MREMMLLWLQNFLRGLLGGRNPEPEAESSPENTVAENKMEECPICGDLWEEGEIFCYHCGYQISDEDLPLFHLPTRTGAFSDPDNILPKETGEKFRERLEAIALGKGIDMAVLILPESIAQKMVPEFECDRRYSIDGVAYGIYNSWQIGKSTELRGMLIVIDPNSTDRALVQGRSGPGISGKTFCGWHKEFTPPEGITDKSVYLSAEIEFIAGKIETI